MTGKDLLEIILLSGLQSETLGAARREFLLAGYDIPKGSLSRAMSQARGSWQKGKFGFQTDGAYFRKGVLVKTITEVDDSLSYQTPQGVISGADLLQIAPSEALEYGIKPSIKALEEKKKDDAKVKGALGRMYYGLIDFMYFKYGADTDAVDMAQQLLLSIEMFQSEYFPANEVWEIPSGNLTLSEAISIVLW